MVEDELSVRDPVGAAGGQGELLRGWHGTGRLIHPVVVSKVMLSKHY